MKLLSVFIAGAIVAYFLIRECLEDDDPCDPQPRLLFTFFYNQTTITGFMKDTSLTTDQRQRGSVQAVDAKGRPAPIQPGTVDYTSSNENVATVEEDPDNENGFLIVAQGAGTAEISVWGDADLGDGVKTITEAIAVTVTDPQADHFTVSLESPEDKPDASTGGEVGTGATGTDASTGNDSGTTEGEQPAGEGDEQPAPRGSRR